jgi:putative acetyltransferase
VIALLSEHFVSLDASNKTNKQEGHVLDLSALRRRSIAIFTAWTATSNQLMGCAVLKDISPGHGEIRSAGSSTDYVRKGVFLTLLKHILDVGNNRRYQLVSLETGAREEFAPARVLYAKCGFALCEPFEGYEDASPEASVFMTYHAD